MAVRSQPLDVFERLLLRFPAFIGIEAHSFFRSGLTQRRHVLFVVRTSHFEFQYWIPFGLQNLLANDFRFINADAETGDVRLLPETEFEQIVNRFPSFSS